MVAREESVLVETTRGHLRELGLPTIFGAAVLFVSATLLLGVNISSLRHDLVWVEHSQQVLRNVANLETGVMGEEMTVRGFALTGDKRFLAYQNSERGKIVMAARQLDRLTVEESGHGNLFRAIRRDLDRHFEFYGKLEGTGPDQAARVAKAIVDPDVRAVTARIRAGLGSLRNAEENALSVRQREMTAQISQAFFLSIGIILAAILLGGFGLLASQLHISLRR